MKSKMTTNYQQPNLKKNPKLNKQLEQEQNHKNVDHMESYQLGGGGGEIGEKEQGISSINGR